LEGISPGNNLLPDELDALKTGGIILARLQQFKRLVDIKELLQAAELRELCSEFLTLHGVQGVLVFQLGNKHGEEIVLTKIPGFGRCRGFGPSGLS
jgi:hypothetical protein